VRHLEAKKYTSVYRYTYGQPVRGRADISVSIQPWGWYDQYRYGFKRANVEVSLKLICTNNLCCV